MKKTKRSEVSQGLFQTIFDQFPLSVQIFSPDGVTIRVNQAWEKLWGITLAQIKNYNILKDPQLKQKGILKFIKKGFAGEASQVPAIKYEPQETKGITDISYLWVKAFIYPVKDKQGQISEVVLVHEDITHAVEAQEKIRQSEQLYRLVVENSQDLISLMDLKSNLLYASPSHEKILGYKLSELIGQNLTSLIHPDDLPIIQEELKKSIQGQVITSSARIKHKDGYWVVIEGVAVVIPNQANLPEMILASSRDITERIEFEKRKDEFISIASHELKTPITTLKSYTQILRQTLSKNIKGLDEHALIYVSKMEDQIVRLTKLIAELLDVSKIQAGKLELQKEQVDLNALLKETIDDMQHMTSKHQIIFQKGRDIKVLADPYRVSQALTNLISNAIKFSPKADKIIVQSKVRLNEVIVSVEDFGIGIAKKNINKIFDRFFQADNKIRVSFSGLGLGLHITSEIIRRHAGKLWVKSVKKYGTTFLFSLPIEVKMKRIKIINNNIKEYNQAILEDKAVKTTESLRSQHIKRKGLSL